MEDANSWIAGASVGAVISFFLLYIRIKKHLKEEIVDPDIKRLEYEIAELEREMSDKISRMEENTSRSVHSLDKKFDEMNSKLDITSQKVSQMQGMLTALFNGLQGNGNNYGQQ